MLFHADICQILCSNIQFNIPFLQNFYITNIFEIKHFTNFQIQTLSSVVWNVIYIYIYIYICNAAVLITECTSWKIFTNHFWDAICSILCQPHASVKRCYSTVEIIPNLCHFKIRASLEFPHHFWWQHILCRSKNSQTLRTIIYSSVLNNKCLQVGIFVKV